MQLYNFLSLAAHTASITCVCRLFESLINLGKFDTLIAGGGNKVITEDITEDPKTAKLEKAEGLMVDKDGYIWFSDGNSGTRKTKILKPGKNGYQDATIILVCKAENGWKDSGTTSPL